MIRRPPRSTRTDTSFPTRRSSDLLADDMMRAILVASAHHTGNLAVCDRNAVAHFRDHRIHSFENLLRNTARMSHPGWTGENEDVGGENLVVQSRPLIAITHVIADAVCDAMIEGSNHLGFDTILAQCIENDRCQCLRIRSEEHTSELQSLM